MMEKTNLVVLVILDGWGISAAGPGNAIKLAHTPKFDSYWHSYPHTTLKASGKAVGLPPLVDGNSETGHLNLGAGRIVFQDLTKINMSIVDGSFFKNKAFLEAIDYVNKQGSTLHLMGLVGGGGVHSSNEHLYALIKLAKEKEVKKLILHLFTDGRDSPPTSAQKYITEIENKIKEVGLGKIGTVMGRYWSMDRDNRWSRTEKAYQALTEGLGRKATCGKQAIKAAYNNKETDEFILPTVIVDKDKKPTGLIEDNDGVIFFNFRVDRPRQLTKAFVMPHLENENSSQEPLFKRNIFLSNLFFLTMMEYEKHLPVKAVAFPPEKITLPLAQVLSENNIRQLHLAETEKERFVTYYFDGYRETPFTNEKWQTILSPKVATYDLVPEMSAVKIAETAKKQIESKLYKFLLINFANPDMVGHTGNVSACVKGIEKVDQCLGKIVETAFRHNGVVIVTADHGNAEEMKRPKSGDTDTKHSINPVPFIVIAKNKINQLQLRQGILADVAPTILKIMGLTKPTQMTGRSLV